jgi:tetratricopeptide (TPR) repeat protein
MSAGDHPKEQQPPQETEGASPPRLAVFKMDGEQKQHLATLTLTRGDGSAWTMQASGPSAEGLAPLLHRFSETRREGAAASPADALAEMLTSEGFVVEKLPAGDHQVNLQIDLKTGTVIGTHGAMHPLAAVDDDLGRRVFEAIAGGLGKAADEVADEIDKRLAEGDIQGAAAEVKLGLDRGLFGLRLSGRLLDALMRIDVSALSPAERRSVRDGRLVTAQQLERFDIAGLEADSILSEDPGTFTPIQIATLKMTSALGALRRGHRETSLLTWRTLLAEPSDLDAEGRGWALRNISNTLPDDDPEALRTAQRSSDAFLEAGNKAEAGKSLMRVANILMQSEPREAVKKLNEMVAVLDKEGLLDRRIRGAALQARANRLAKLNRHKDAFLDAVEAVEMRRGLLGVEAEFISSLHLAALEAATIGETEKADAYATEAETLTAELKIPHFQLAERVSALVTAFDANTAENLLRDAEAAGNLEVIAGVNVIRATMDPSLTDMQRLERLEETYTRLTKARVKHPILHPVSLAMAKQLLKMEQFARAVEWFRKILARDPYDNLAAPELVNTLWKTKKWGEAAIFIKQQLDLRGEQPGILYVYGKSLFESGDLSGAVSALTKSRALAQDENLKKSAGELRELALQSGGTVVPPNPAPATGPVTRDEFEAALAEFAAFIAGRKRMDFWRPGEKDHEWIESPERQAQNFLHIYLQARFGSRVEIFEELATGAGRLDLYVRLIGGLSIVVELKMAGFRYSSPYAAFGEDQIIHYMENRRTHLGYLIVFDARLDKYREKLLSVAAGQHTVIEVFVDVRPRFGRRTN